MTERSISAALFSLALVGCTPGWASSASFPTSREAQQEGTVCFDDSVRSRVQNGGCAVAGDSLRVRFRNELSSAFVLRRATLALDGEIVLDVSDEDLLSRRMFVGTIRELDPGEHVLESTWTLQGEGSSVFSYLRGYRFETRNAVRVRVKKGGAPMAVAAAERPPVLTLVAFDATDPTTPIEQRPRLRSELEPPGP